MSDRKRSSRGDSPEDQELEAEGPEGTMKDIKHTPPNDESPNRVWDGTRVRAREDDDE